MAALDFYIGFNIKTSKGFQTFGKFFLGSNRRFAESLFNKLKGTKKISRETILNLEFIETKNQLPQNVQMISCTLDELAENCKTITRETFKFYNMAET
jgi:hypothetical protein